MHTNASDELCDSIIVASSDASLFEEVLAESRVTDSESELLLLRRLGGWQILCEELLEHRRYFALSNRFDVLESLFSCCEGAHCLELDHLAETFDVSDGFLDFR